MSDCSPAPPPAQDRSTWKRVKRNGWRKRPTTSVPWLDTASPCPAPASGRTNPSRHRLPPPSHLFLVLAATEGHRRRSSVGVGGGGALLPPLLGPEAREAASRRGRGARAGRCGGDAWRRGRAAQRSGWWCTTACGCGGNAVSYPCDAPGWCGGDSGNGAGMVGWPTTQVDSRWRGSTGPDLGPLGPVWVRWALDWSGSCAWVCNHLLLLLPPPPSFPTWYARRLRWGRWQQ
jgi:hypothetical protein